VPFHSSLEPLDVIRKTLINVAYFLPAGILVSGLSRQLIGGRWALLRVLAIGIALAGSIEFMQLLVVSRYFDATDIVTGSLAVVAGWGLMQVSRARSDSLGQAAAMPLPLRSVLFLAWTAALLFINWEPFNFTADQWQLRLREFNWVPFADYYAGNYLNSFDQIVQKTALFIPFGLLWPAATGSRADVVFGVVSALLLATAIEIGQMFLPEQYTLVNDLMVQAERLPPSSTPSFSHYPGISDLIIATFGAWVGCVVARRLRVTTGERAGVEVYKSRALAT
jgi:glycopeptide antibiotics resistance protein